MAQSHWEAKTMSKRMSGCQQQRLGVAVRDSTLDRGTIPERSCAQKTQSLLAKEEKETPSMGAENMMEV